MRVGVYGGAFDPPHLGHLVAAERCREAARLDEVWLLPTYRPPHKDPAGVGRWEHRLEMAQLAVAGHPHFRVNGVERELPPPSYTVRTLEELRRRHPAATFALILGADSVRDLPGWHRPGELVRAAELVAAARPGSEAWDAARLAAAVGVPEADVRLTWAEMPLLDVSSRDLRARLRAGRSVRFLLPRAVEEYAREKGVYGG